MRQLIATLALATTLAACGAAAAHSGSVSGPAVEDRSYDRIEALRSLRATSQTDPYDRIEQLRSANGTQTDPYDRIEQLRGQR